MKKTKKFLSIILAILMIVTTVPFVFAADTEPSAEATKYPVWVAGIQVTSANIIDVLEDGTVSYDPGSNTLTLKNAVISGTDADGINSNEDLIISGDGTISGNHGIYLKSGNLTIDGNVELINATSYYGVCANAGSVTITENGNVGAVTAVQSIYAKGDIVIDGTVGKITATGSSGIITSEGNIMINGEIGDIDVEGDNGIRAANGTVMFSADSEVGNITSNVNAISAKNISIIGKVGNLTAANGINATDTVTITGTVGDITATGNGVYAVNNININGNVGTVFGNNCGIVSTAGNISISGTVDMVSSKNYAAINANGTISVSNTSVVADGKGISGSAIETTDNGGILAVNGSEAKVYGDFNLDKYSSTELTFEKLTLLSGAKLTIPFGETLEVETSLNNGGTINNLGTLKLPADTAKTGISGGIMYIGEKGFQWNDKENAYRCLNDTHTEDTETIYCSECGEKLLCEDCGSPAHGESFIEKIVCLITMFINLIISIFA